MMGRTICAVAFSLLAHVLLAVGLAAYLEYAPQPDAPASLELSSVELSFADEDLETAMVAPMPPSDAQSVPRPTNDERPPEPKLEKPSPSVPGKIKLPEPKKEPPKLVAQRASLAISPSAASRQARVDAPPRPMRSIKPVYPDGARQRGEQGDVVVELHVDAKGTVGDVRVVVSSGFSELDEAAVRAVRTAKFSPARSDRDAVASIARLKLQFKLR